MPLINGKCEKSSLDAIPRIPCVHVVAYAAAPSQMPVEKGEKRFSKN